MVESNDNANIGWPAYWFCLPILFVSSCVAIQGKMEGQKDRKRIEDLEIQVRKVRADIVELAERKK